MTIPLVILAVCAVLVGLIFGSWTGNRFEHHLEHTAQLHPAATEHAVEHSADLVTPILGTLVGLAGLALSYLLYGLPSPIPGRLAGQLRPLYQASLNKFYVDEFYNRVIV